MANQEHLDILKQGVKIWNQWRKEHADVKPDLSRAGLQGTYLQNANLSGAYLVGTDLSDARLIQANLSRANLKKAGFSGADLVGANLSGAHLQEARAKRADLQRVNLSGADLSRASILEANLRGADLSGAHLRGADLKLSDLSYADLSYADLSYADLRGVLLIQTNFTGATLTQCSIYGISAWNVQLEGAKQDNLVITDSNEPTITVDNLKVAQFVYLLLNHQELRGILNSVMERGVLLLGRFGGGGLELLQAIAEKLREMEYLPIIFDFERPDSRDFTETIMTLAGLSRFVIVDLSGPSVPNELRATIPHFKIPFVPIIEEGRKIFSMFPDLLGYPWVLTPVEFTNKEQLIELLPTRVIEPAEEKFKERQALLNQLFNR